MKIALIGSRGIPARYSGFEQFYEQFAVRLAKRGHDVTVYNRSHFIKDVKKEYKGVRIVSLPSIPTKHLDTIVHTTLSTLHALFCRYDVIYTCIAGNSPVIWPPRIFGTKTVLNVDGEDWAREKWRGFAKWYQLKCEWLATKTANILIADAQGVQVRYREKYTTDTVFVPYGANIRTDERLDALKKWKLQPREYFLYVGRFVPENAIDLLIRSFRKVKTEKKLVIIGDAPYTGDYKAEIKRLAAEDPRVILTGYAFGNDYAQLSSHAYVYVQPSGVDGTRPALLDQMGFGNCVLVRNSIVNMEVIGDCGCFFEKERLEDSLTEVVQDLVEHPERVEALRSKVLSRIENYYNWEWVTSFYEDLFQRLIRKETLISYGEFLKKSDDHSA